MLVYDQTTKVILDALTQKAKQGVKIRILMDYIGSFGIYFKQQPLKALKKAGAEVSFFIPFFDTPFQSYLNLRNHRKIYLFDQSRVLSGGMNLSNAYMGRADGSRRWKDILYFLKGPAVYNFYQIFLNDWSYATGQEIKAKPETLHQYESDHIVQVVPSGPDIQKDALYEALLSAIYRASSEGIG